MTGAPSDSYHGGLFRSPSAGNLSRRIKALRRRNTMSRPPSNKPSRSPKRDQVAELLSLDLDFDQIAERTGMSKPAVKRHFVYICKALGPQAV